MLFNSLPFIIFLPTFFILYWFVFNKSLKYQNLLILISSYFFYGWWNWKFVFLLLLSTILDFFYGFAVYSSNSKRSKFFLILSVICNLSVLGFFKYYNFFISEFSNVLKSFGIDYSPIFLNILLPVGISFYTFHGMSYVFDIYYKKQKPVKSFIDYAVFVSFFPLLVAGPIERANHLLPQVQIKRVFNYNQALGGCRLILWGLFKKVFIADSLSGIVNNIFDNYQDFSGPTLIVGAIAFAFQIYCDFSGYSDVALGTAKLLGFELLSNFKFPYFSRNIPEFWRRWHISLSSWFRDYLYIPLGGSRKGNFNTVINTLIIFTVSGFWHGASWNFIVWGVIHALGFLPFVLFKKNRSLNEETVAFNKMYPSIKELFQMLMTFLFVTFAWIFFRAENLTKAVDYISIIFSDFNNFISNFRNIEGLSSFKYIIVLIILDWYLRYDERNLKVLSSVYWRRIIYFILFSCVLIKLLSPEQQQFIYFQF